MLSIAKLRAELDKRRDEPWMVADFIKCHPEIEAADLSNLAWLLASQQFGCSYNDVVGLIDYLEIWQQKQTEAGDAPRSQD